MRQAAFVINPVRARHVELLKARCRQAAARHGWEALFMGTEAGETGPELSSHLEVYAGQPGDKLVFAVGGDGTVRACAHALAGSGIALAIVPRGTANLFARALGVPSDLAGALFTGFCGLDLDVDVPDADGQTFVAMAGLGIDAAVVEGTPKLLKDYLGWLAYAQYRTSPVRSTRSPLRSTAPHLWCATLIVSWLATSVCCPAVSTSSRVPASTTASSTWEFCPPTASLVGLSSPGAPWVVVIAPGRNWSTSKDPV